MSIAGRVWLIGISGVEWDGWIPSSLSPLQLVYRVNIVDGGVLILFLFIFFVHVLYWMAYSGISGIEWDELGRVWWMR